MAFSIYKPCNSTVTFNGVGYEIDMAFDNILDVRDVLNGTGSEPLKVRKALALLLADPNQLDLLGSNEGVEFVNTVISELVSEDITMKVIATDIKGNPMPGQNTDTDDDTNGAVYDIDYDATYIYSSFLSAYGINLHKQFGKLHWQEFQTLLRDLPESTSFGEIVKIRSTRLSDIKDRKEKERIRKLQKRYKLPNKQ